MNIDQILKDPFDREVKLEPAEENQEREDEEKKGESRGIKIEPVEEEKVGVVAPPAPPLPPAKKWLQLQLRAPSSHSSFSIYGHFNKDLHSLLLMAPRQSFSMLHNAQLDGAGAAAPQLNVDAPASDLDKEWRNFKVPGPCPRGCSSDGRKDTKQNRILHAKAFHYPQYYHNAGTFRTELQQFWARNLGDKRRGPRVCLHCARRYANFLNRGALLRHIHSVHFRIFEALVVEENEIVERVSVELDAMIASSTE